MHYILENDVPKLEPDTVAWALWFQTAQRQVADDELPSGTRVSTVFLSIDHNFSGRGEPVLYETMIFGGPLDEEQWRYHTKDEALAGHAAALVAARQAER